MRASTFLLVPLLTTVCACGGSGAADSVEPADAGTSAALPTRLSDAEILARIYDPEYSVPDGFFIDPRADTDRSYTVHHVLDDSNSYELCTDDYQTAVAWEESDNATRAVSGAFVSATETPRYFEFVRELEYGSDAGNVGDPMSPGFARVFKCSNTNRDGVDRTLLDGYAGAINSRPIGPTAVRDFTEYLWQFRFFPSARGVVLDSVKGSANNHFQQTLKLAFRHRQGADRCDRIELADWRFSVDRATGYVEKRFSTGRSFEARLVAGTPTICD